MNDAIANYLKANRMKYELSLVYDEDFVAAIVDMDQDPIFVACGNTPTEALDKLARQLEALA